MPAPTRHSQQFRHRAEVAARNDTMKLSRAIVVVILMHVVAVGGVLAFSLLHEGNQPLQTEARAKEDGAKKKETARKTAPTPGLEAPKPAAAALPIPALKSPAPADPLESQALAILQGGAPAKPNGPTVSTRGTAVPSKLSAKPELRPASTTASARSPKKDEKAQRN
ncbi:MAG: hypothetical protein JSR82_03635 [Verrucomicrobia bacterium]|nr:hypothetical protein [Verrucomicrobiota bacterium]